MPIQIFSRVKDGALSQVSGTPNAAHIRYTYKKKQFKYKINKVGDRDWETIWIGMI